MFILYTKINPIQGWRDTQGRELLLGGRCERKHEQKERRDNKKERSAMIFNHCWLFSFMTCQPLGCFSINFVCGTQ